MKIGKMLITGSLFYFVSTANSATQIIDVMEIAGKSQEEVTSYLGEETSCEKTKYGRKCFYEKGEIEIVFIQEKADWITIGEMDAIPFSKSGLNAIGLSESEPSFKSGFVLRWEPFQSFRSIALFKGVSNTDYAYIKVATN